MEQTFASRVTRLLDSQGLPGNESWAKTPAVAFHSDWHAENPDPERKTQVRLLWSPDCLFVRFDCRYREIFAYEGTAGRRDKLWMRDVAEVFIRPETGEPKHYKEFEISPNGDWLDLDISPGNKSVLLCEIKSRVVLDPGQRTWTAELGIPMSCLTDAFDPGERWRLNFFRIEGPEPNRFYSAWIPTYTPQPNFHVPEVFGTLYLR